MSNIPNLDYINLRIDNLVAALKVAPDRSDIKLKLMLYQALKKKHPDVKTPSNEASIVE